MLEDYPDILNSYEVMEILAISKNPLYKLIHSNKLPAYRIGKRVWRFNKKSLIEYLLNLEK